MSKEESDDSHTLDQLLNIMISEDEEYYRNEMNLNQKLKDVNGVLQRQYIIERMEKYLMKYDLYDLIELYVDIKNNSIKYDTL